MFRYARFSLLGLGLWAGAAEAQAPAPAPAPAGPSEVAKGMVGAWEISNAARDKTCPVTFSLDAGAGGFKLELDPRCGTVFPSLKDVVVWAMGPNDAVRLLDSKGVIILNFTEVENRMYEAERKGEGLYFMRTQAAIKAVTVKPGCDASVLDLGLATWRIDSNELLLVGRGSTWRFSESDSTTWERIPPSA